MKKIFYKIAMLVLIFNIVSFENVFVADKRSAPNNNISKQSLFMAGMDLKVGMSQKYILDTIDNIYSVHKLLKGDTWFIMEGEGENKRMVGYVQFSNGKLINAMKNWGNFSAEEGFKFGQAILSTVMQIKSEWKDSVYVETNTTRQPNINYNSIFIYYGHKYIRIGINENDINGNNYKATSIQEYLCKD